MTKSLIMPFLNGLSYGFQTCLVSAPQNVSHFLVINLLKCIWFYFSAWPDWYKMLHFWSHALKITFKHFGGKYKHNSFTSAIAQYWFNYMEEELTQISCGQIPLFRPNALLVDVDKDRIKAPEPSPGWMCGPL